MLNARLTGASFPCLDVELSKGASSGYAVVRAPLERTHIVVVPTTRVTGVEDMALRDGRTENYFADAWAARHFVEEKAPRPLTRDDLGLALNSRPGRSQDQLHIHVDCLKTGVRDALRRLGPAMSTERWTKLAVPFHGDRYWALKLVSPDLRGVNVLDLVANGLHVAEGDEALVTIVLAGATFPHGGEGFYLLAMTAAHGRAGQGHGEYLQDHACAG